MRIVKFSVQVLKESHETIQRLTSQMLSMQEQMGWGGGSGGFQEVESNQSGGLSYVPSQPAMIPSSRSVLSCEKTLAI